jgi:mRNA interferase HigB
VRIISRSTLQVFWHKYPECEQPLKSWFAEIKKSNWENLNQLKKTYPNASILKNNRIVFNIKGNNYRLIVKINFEHQLCWIRFIGTHREYNNIDANTV